MIARIACGMMIRRNARPRLMPKACAVSACPLSTESNPARMISAIYAASFSARPAIAAVSGVIRSLVFQLIYSGPNGIPSTTRGDNVDMLPEQQLHQQRRPAEKPDKHTRQAAQQHTL